MSCITPLASRPALTTNSAIKILTRFSHSPASLFQTAYHSRHIVEGNEENDSQHRNNFPAGENANDVEKLFCISCGTGFPSRLELEIHIRDHHDTSSDEMKGNGHICPTCSKIFRRSGDLKKHNRFHTGERPFRCSMCSKSFHQSGHLKNHIRIHTNERPFACSICYRGFRQSCNLKRHMKTHGKFPERIAVKTI